MPVWSDLRLLCGHTVVAGQANTAVLVIAGLLAACMQQRIDPDSGWLGCRYGIIVSQMVFISIDIFATICLGYAMTLARPARSDRQHPQLAAPHHPACI